VVAGNRHNHKNEIYLRISHDVWAGEARLAQRRHRRCGRCSLLSWAASSVAEQPQQQQQMWQEWFGCDSVGELGNWRLAASALRCR